jgi:hypothetical protein
MSEDNFAHLACPNPDCPAYGQRGAGNLRPHGWSGKGHRIGSCAAPLSPS